MLNHQKQALLTAKELFPEATISQLIDFAKTIEHEYYNAKILIPLIDFCQTTVIRHPIYGVIPFSPYGFQKEYLTTLEHSSHVLSVTARQMGSSYMLATYALWKVSCIPLYTAHNISNNFTNAIELKSKINILMSDSSNYRFSKVSSYSGNSISFTNGSNIIFYNANNYNAIDKDINMLIIDNAAFISYSVFDRLWKNISQKYNTDFQIIMNSNAGYSNGLFHKLFSDDENEYNFNRLSIPWQKHPDRNQEWADYTITQIEQEQFDQEYNCKFISKIDK